MGEGCTMLGHDYPNPTLAAHLRPRELSIAQIRDGLQLSNLDFHQCHGPMMKIKLLIIRRWLCWAPQSFCRWEKGGSSAAISSQSWLVLKKSNREAMDCHTGLQIYGRKQLQWAAVQWWELCCRTASGNQREAISSCRREKRGHNNERLFAGVTLRMSQGMVCQCCGDSNYGI